MPLEFNYEYVVTVDGKDDYRSMDMSLAVARYSELENDGKSPGMYCRMVGPIVPLAPGTPVRAV